MSDKIIIEERVLDGDQLGPVTVDIDTKEFTGSVTLEDSLLDGTGSEIVIEVSESLGVVGINDLVEVKQGIDASANRAEHSVQEAQRQIDKANQTIADLNTISSQINNLVDTAKTAAATSTNKAHEAETSATNSDKSAQAAKASQTAAKASQTAAKASQDAAKTAELNAIAKATEAATQAAAATTQAAEATKQATEATKQAAEATKQATNAEAAKTAAIKAQLAAKASEDKALFSAGNASTSESRAKASQDAAKLSETNAANSATEAGKFASSMTQSVTDAQAAKAAAVAASNNAQTYANNSKSSADAANTKAAEASDSATNAKTSQDAAKSSEQNAFNSQTAAKASQDAAKASQDAAKASETKAATSATKAADSETKAAASATKAADSATIATTKSNEIVNSANQTATSAGLAADSASKAADSATASANSATASANSATASDNSATASDMSAKAAKVSETNAANSAKAADTSAKAAKASETSVSAKLTQAATSASQAATSASQALASKNSAATSATAASQSASNSTDSATAAATSASEALASEMEAKKSKDAAKVSETNAANSAKAADTSAKAAKASQTAATTAVADATAKAKAASDSAASAALQANNASASATYAASSATAAKASRDEAEKFAEELRKGSVYRGTWNPNSGKYPDAPQTNSRWDVQLNKGQLEKVFDGKEWNWGDRLIYILDSKKFDIIDSGTGVTSVNGDTGSVTVTPASIGALPITGGILSDNLTIAKSGNATLRIIDTNTTNGNGPRLEFNTGNSQGVELYHVEHDPDLPNGGYGLKVQRAPSNTQSAGATLVVQGDIYEQENKRVYSEANKPSASDVGALSINGGTVNGSIDVTGSMSAGKFALKNLTASIKDVLTGSTTAINVGNTSLSKVNLVGTALTHNDSPVYTEANKPVPYDIGAVAQHDAWKKYTRVYSVSVGDTAELLNYEGKAVDTSKPNSYYIRVFTNNTGTITGAVYLLRGSAGAGKLPSLSEVALLGRGSNHPEISLEGTKAIIKTSHSSHYDLVVQMEEIEEDANPWCDITSAYKPNNPVPWDKVDGKPDQATRWPKFSEVTEVPETATRWSKWAEVADKPVTATRWPTWTEVGGNAFIKTVPNVTHLQAADWLKAASNEKGFLPAEQNNIIGNSFLGNSSWWFRQAWVNSYHGNNINLSGDVTATGATIATDNDSHPLTIKRFQATSERAEIYRADTELVFDMIEDAAEHDSVLGGFHFRGSQDGVNGGAFTTYLRFNNQGISYKGNKIYHEGDKPTLTELGALGKTEKAADSSHLEGRTLSQVISDARSGYATTSYSYSKAQADSRFIQQNQASIGSNTAGDAELRADAGTNKDATLYLTEDSKNHGTYIRYSGTGNNITYYGTRQGNVETNFMSVTRGANTVRFPACPTVSGGQSATGDALTKRNWVEGELAKKADTSSATIGKVQLKSGSTIGGTNPTYASLVIEGKLGIDGNEVVSAEDLYIGTLGNNVHIREGASDLANFSSSGLNVTQGNITERGKRVYSENNKPKIVDIAQPTSTTKTLTLKANEWTKFLVSNDNLTESGVYQILINYHSAGKGGTAYFQGYTGQFYWYAEGVNDNATAEIPLHHMGHADQGEYIYLRTRTNRGNSINQFIEIKCNKALTDCPFTVKLVRIM